MTNLEQRKFLALAAAVTRFLLCNRSLDPPERLLKPVQCGVQSFIRHGAARYHIAAPAQQSGGKRPGKPLEKTLPCAPATKNRLRQP